MKKRSRQKERLQQLFDAMKAGGRKSTYSEICGFVGINPIRADNLLYESLGVSGADFMQRTGYGRKAGSRK